MDMYPNDQFRGRGFMMGDFGGGHHGYGALAWVIFALEIVLLAGIAMLLIRAFAAPAFAGPPRRMLMRRHGPPRDPLAHLRMRYARGDISREDYLQATQDLGGEPPAAD